MNLAANGWGNDFYAAAVQSMTKSWEAFFFGSFDAGNVITVDKPPAALWVMALSARVFGLSSWSILVPQALMARRPPWRCSTRRCGGWPGRVRRCSPVRRWR